MKINENLMEGWEIKNEPLNMIVGHIYQHAAGNIYMYIEDRRNRLIQKGFVNLQTGEVFPIMTIRAPSYKDITDSCSLV